MTSLLKMLIQKLSQMLGSVRDGLRSLLPVIILVIYTVIGAVLFLTLEGPQELHTYETMKKDREDLLENTAFRLNNIRAMTPLTAYNHTVKTLQRFQEKLGVDNVPEDNQQWTFFGAIFYCMTVYTTIGYGNIVPVTTAGRIMTIIYAFFGIPLAVICLFGLGSLFAKLCRILWKAITKSTAVVSKDLGEKMEGMAEADAKKVSPDGTAEVDDDDLLSFPIWFLVLLTVIWIFICAGLFMLWEKDWDYGTSLYFTLISFTTIGFGDVLPSEYDYMIVVGILLLIGLSLVSTVMTLIQQQLEALASGVQTNIDKEYLNALAEAQDEGEVIVEPELNKKKENGEGVAEGVDLTEQDVEAGEGPTNLAEHRASLDPRSLDAVVSRMPLKSRMMYHIMPESSKKQLRKHSEAKMNYKNRSCQTDDDILREYALQKFKEDFKAVNYVVVQDFSGQETPSTTVFHGDVGAPQSQQPVVNYSHPRKIDIKLHPHKSSRESHSPEEIFNVPVHFDEPKSTTTVQMPQRAELVHEKSESEEESVEFKPTKRTATLVFPSKKDDVKDTDV